jgi:hypothetical protein
MYCWPDCKHIVPYWRALKVMSSTLLVQVTVGNSRGAPARASSPMTPHAPNAASGPLDSVPAITAPYFLSANQRPLVHHQNIHFCEDLSFHTGVVYYTVPGAAYQLVNLVAKRTHCLHQSVRPALSRSQQFEISVSHPPQGYHNPSALRAPCPSQG